MKSTKDLKNNKTNDDYYEPVIKHKKSKSNKGAGAVAIAALLLFAAVIGVTAGALTSKKSQTKMEDHGVVVSQAATEQPAQATDVPQTEQSEPAQAAAKSAAAIPAAGAGANDFIDVIAEARKNGMTKRAYLTFDDGPSSIVTPQILDTLKENGIKATFFECGNAIEENPDMTKRAVNEGHLIANHSYSHNYNKLYATEGSFREEVEKTQSLIESVTGAPVTFKLFRFPGGSYNAGDHAAEKQVYKNTLASMGYYYCDWNTLNGDAEGAPKDAAGLVEFFKTNAQSFVEQDKNVIVLMHDSDAKQGTADALKRIIDYLLGYGYTFHRLDEVTL